VVLPEGYETMKFDNALQEWLTRKIALSHDPANDRRILTEHVAVGEEILASLPAKADRSESERRVAEQVHDCSRALRREFLSLHAEWLFDSLTDRGMLSKRISELAYEASEKCPGLVPTRAQIADELQHLQKHKEEREIDQGLLLQSWLAHPRIGLGVMRAMLRPTRRATELLERFEQDGEIVLETVTLQRHQAAGHITLHNLSCLNAEDNQLVDDLETAVDLVLLSPSIKAGIMRGGIMTHPRYAGRRVFSAGINLKNLNAGKISFLDFLMRREFGFISKIMRGLRPEQAAPHDIGPFLEWQKPWLAVVDSFAIGGGAQLLLAFDRVIATPDSFISLPAAQEGIVPGLSNLRLTRAVGARIARQIILFGRKIWATEPAGSLVIDEIVEAASMEEAIARNASDLCSPAVVANRHMLNLSEEPLEAMRHYATDFALLQAVRLYSPDVLNKTRFA
jgi:thioesterase DpgC